MCWESAVCQRMAKSGLIPEEAWFHGTSGVLWSGDESPRKRNTWVLPRLEHEASGSHHLPHKPQSSWIPCAPTHPYLKLQCNSALPQGPSQVCPWDQGSSYVNSICNIYLEHERHSVNAYWIKMRKIDFWKLTCSLIIFTEINLFN